MTEKHLTHANGAPFSPANVVPGIGFSPDRMLQPRLFSYGDAERYRLGVNHTSIPVSAPKCPYHSFVPSRRPDAGRRQCGLDDRLLSEFPVSVGDGHIHRAIPGTRRPGGSLRSPAGRRPLPQPGDLFRLMSPTQQQALFENTARAMDDAGLEVKHRHIGNCMRADPAYGAGVAVALVIPLSIAAE